MSVHLNEELAGVPSATYGTEYNSHLLEEYKLYVSMADKISERRQTANTFFLTLNSAALAALGFAWPAELSGARRPWLFVVAAVGMVVCLSWYRLLRSYRDLNSAKFTIVGALEALLPVKPYAAEWKLVGEGKVSRLYLPLTHIETKVPFFFMLLYLGVAIIVPWAKGSELAPEKAQTTVFLQENGCSSLPLAPAPDATPKYPGPSGRQKGNKK
jgi:hypothetical protein